MDSALALSTRVSTGRPTARNAALTSRLAVCVWIPLFPLRLEERRRPEPGGKPTAIIDPRDARRVWQVSPLARRVGVRSGLTVSQAIGLCPALSLLEADPVYYDEQFSRLVQTLSAISPVIEPMELGQVYVGVDGVTGLYGSPERQLAVIRRVVSEWAGDVDGGGLEEKCGRGGVRLGWGEGKFTAWAAAKQAKPGGPGVIVTHDQRASFLERQSVATLPVDPDTLRRLWQLGIKTLGDLAALPREAVISQYGREGRTAWQLAAGYLTEPVVGRDVPEPITVSVDFPIPFADRLLLGHAIDALIDRALKHPRRIGQRVYVARVRAALEHGASWLATVTLKDPTAHREHIAAPIRVKLEQSPPPGAVETLALEFVEFVPGTKELQLFTRDASSAARAGRRRALRWAANEIRTRLKQPMLHHIIEVHPWSRLPERRYALIDFDP
jgi:nucleotidyltransferase/DNA polymerase involved in DNA repair